MTRTAARRLHVDAIIALLAVTAVVGCADKPLPLEPTREAPPPAPAPTPEQIRAELDKLNAWENEIRGATDFSQLAPFESRSGANPHVVVAVSADLAVGALRGTNEVVLLDADATELARLPAPRSPIDIAVGADGIYVAGEESSEIAIYRLDGRTLVRDGAFDSKLLAPKAIAAAGSRVFVADDASGELVAFDGPTRARQSLGRGHGPLDLATTDNHLVAVYSLDHELRVWRLGDTIEPLATPITHDGPLWGAVATESDGALYIAASGIEDRPLDRSDEGSFGYIDSFAFVYRLRDGEAERVASVNISAHRLITAKWLELEVGAPSRLRLGSYGGDRTIELRWPTSGFEGEPAVASRVIAPGTTSIARLGKGALLANPLLDGWVRDDGTSFRHRAEAASDPRSVESRVGELLFFTSLMAPWGESTDKRSRFTCEACHVEGYVDGRTHFTGRMNEGAKVSATSRPLRGLFNNRPHFTRALDETTTEMVDNEFGVANKLNGRSPWFELRAADFPWLAHVEGVPAVMSPVYLRRSLMLFLRDFTHRQNPHARGRDALTANESRGAALFRDHCERCHNARTVADDESTAVPFETWPSFIFEKPGVLVWGRSGYEKTGIEPYVHALGARPPTLRRLYKKWPYFTNGSAKTVDEVLARVRVGTDLFDHSGGKRGKALSKRERADLGAFLQLL